MGDNGCTPQEYAQYHMPLAYNNMVILDAIILNDDRHMKNWSYQFNADSNILVGLAPNYDFNNAFRADRNTLSGLIFDDLGKKVNLLKAARLTYQKYGTTLKLEYLYNIIDNINLPINKITLKNRILYITGKKDNQRDCY